ncbi:hypothetical protein FUAX_17520 [Fulvitalea axinellae]|uniref:PKD domain-containing protein n=1 Tax=Fulvitalea axinellae TaxID=1182444 RepID=A0AAU9CJ40_9BACT|nr:hypothetical protein FUAX_17520 [Fulvitalea axinellae]
MKRLYSLSALLALAFMASSAFAQIRLPKTKYWSFHNLLEWTESSASQDPLDAMYRSNVKLRDRFSYKPSQANPSLDPARSMSIWNGMKLEVRASDNAQENAFKFWQYIDTWAIWNGGGTRIQAPSPHFVDAAHRNGVRALGIVIWAWGGSGVNPEIEEMLRTENGVYVHAHKLVDIARHYGFDGWSFNIEFLGNVNKTKMVAFLQAMQTYADSLNFDNFKTLWYDARNHSGGVSFQNRLTTSNSDYFQYNGKVSSDYFFLNYNWSTSHINGSISRAESLGRNPYDVQVGLTPYTQGNSDNGKNNFADLVGKKIGISKWIDYTVGEELDLSDPVARRMDLDKRRIRTYSGPNSDPTSPGTALNSAPNDKSGHAIFIAERSVINDYPFFTKFNPGYGFATFKDGKKVANGQWHDLSAQDLLPSFRWWFSQGGGSLTPEMHYLDAYDGSASLRIHGSSSNADVLRLYKVKLPVSQQTKIALAYKAEHAMVGADSGFDIAIATESGNSLGAFQYFPVGAATADDWNTTEIDLSPLSGQTMAVIGIRCKGNISNFDLKLGELTLTDGAVQTPQAPTIVSASVLETKGEESTMRLAWETAGNQRYNVDEGIAYFEVYRQKADGTDLFLARTTARMTDVLAVDLTDQSALFKVVAVGLDGKTVSPNSPAYSTPVASFATSDVYLKKGQSVTLTNTSKNAVSYSWTVEGASPESSTDVNPVVTFPETGLYKVKLVAQGTELGRADSVVKTIKVIDPANTVAPTIAFSANTTQISEGGTATFSYTGTPGMAHGPGKAIAKRGGNGHSSSGPSLTGKPFTISCWYRADAVNGTGPWIVAIGGKDCAIRNRENEGIDFTLGKVDGRRRNLWAAEPAVKDRWYHIAATHDGSKMKIYLDGELSNEIATSGFNTGIGSGIHVGKNTNGTVDEVRIYSRALSQAEIQAGMYVGLKAPYESRLEAYYTFDKLTNGKFEDLANNYDLTDNGTDKVDGHPMVSTAEPQAMEANNLLYRWEFEGGDPAVSFDAQPTVTYTEEGTYSVTLKVSSMAGSVMETKDAYIQVGEDTTNPPQTVDVVLSPVADAYVYGKNKGTNYGTGADILVKEGGSVPYIRRGYFKFDLSSLPAGAVVNSASFDLAVKSSNGTAQSTAFNLSTVADDSWTETGVNWNNMPQVGAVADSQTGTAAGTVMSFDVEQESADALTDGALSLHLRSAVAGPAYLTFHSREASDASLRPKLRVTYTVPAAPQTRQASVEKMEMEELPRELEIFPNPVNDILTVRAGSSIQSLGMFTLSGQKVLGVNADSDVVSLDLSSFGKGVYVLKIQTAEHGTSVRRIIKE